MTSNQPYMLRAFYEWIVDNNMTPYVVVDAHVPGTLVPQEHVRDGQIVLNISPSACAKLEMGNVDISFEARFGGVAKQLNVPCRAVLAIYAKENGAGTVFTAEDEYQGDEAPADAPKMAEEKDLSDAEVEQAPRPPKKGKPTLKVIK